MIGLLGYWRVCLAALAGLYIALLHIQLAGEKRHSAKVETRLRETTEAFDKTVAEVRAKTELLKARDAAHAARVERDQSKISQEKLSAYHSELAALHARHNALLMRTGKAQANPGSGGDAAVPGIPDASSGIDDSALKDRFLASEIALRLKALQDWVRGQQGVDRTNP